MTIHVANAFFMFLLAVTLSGCTRLHEPNAEQAHGDVAILEGSSSLRFIYDGKADIAAVDGKRMDVSIFVSKTNTVQILPGHHWIESTSEMHYLLGGMNMCTCAFEFDAKAGHRYELQADANTYDVPCLKQQRFWRYKGLVAVKEYLNDKVIRSYSPGAVCTGGGPPVFCRNNADCEYWQGKICIQEESSKFGFCRQRDR